MAPSTAAGTVTVTRVVPPVAPARYVVREHLLEPLRVAVEDPAVALVLVSAAAGAGKTTLLGAAARAADHRRLPRPGRARLPAPTMTPVIDQ